MTRNRRSRAEAKSLGATQHKQPAPSSRAGKPAEMRCEKCPEITVARHPYRVFISYSHQDRELATRLEKHLKSEGLFPITDHEIRVGEAFSEEIREMIECAHIFMPLVTPSANERLWVQQEIGYATALHVPVCPVAVGNLPSGMAEHIQGIHIADIDGRRPTDDQVLAIVEDRLTYAMIDDLVRRARRRPRQGRYDCTLYWADRQGLLVNLTENAYREGCKLARSLRQSKEIDRQTWRLRQCAAFGSFSIPDASVDSEDWDRRDPDRYRSQYDRRLLRRERQAMEAYVKCFGCDFIVDPRISGKRQGVVGLSGPDHSPKPVARRKADASGVKSEATLSPTPAAAGRILRIRLVIEFIEDYFHDDRVRVVIPATPGQITTNLIIVGDWFAAEAVVPHYRARGYERTMFTRHAPTVLNMIARFNQDFEDCLREAGWDPGRTDTTRKAKAAALKVLRTSLSEVMKGL